MATLTLTPDQLQILWACDASWNAGDIPFEHRMLCFSRIIERYRVRFGGDFHQAQLGRLCRAGLLSQLHAVRGGGRRYYRLTDPDLVRELVKELDLS